MPARAGTTVTKSGTTLIEVLVVMVIFLIGILAVAQMFPAGFHVLNESRNRITSSALGKDMSALLSGSSEMVPVGILPSPMTAVNGGVVDRNRSPFDTSLYNEANAVFNADGTIAYGGTNVGNYRYFAGPNVFNGIDQVQVGIPADPTRVAILPYGPTFQTAQIATNIVLMTQPYTVIQGEPLTNSVNPGQAFLQNADSGTAALEASILPNSGTTPNFFLSAEIYYSQGGVTKSLHLDQISVPSGTVGTVSGGVLTISFASLAPAGSTFLSVDPQSIQLQRQFDQVLPTGTFTASDPYEYKVMQPLIGIIQFNPAASGYRVLSADGTQVPLTALADYTILDWSIFRDTIQLRPDQQTFRLTMPELQVIGDSQADQISYPGLELPNQGASGVSAPSDIVFIDASNGALLMYDPNNQGDPANSDFLVNKSNGWIQPNIATGFTNYEYLLDPSTSTGYAVTPTPVDLSNVTVIAMYRAKGNWMRMPVVAPRDFFEYNPLVSPEPPYDYTVSTTSTRIYFAPMMAGQKVRLDLAYYDNAAGVQMLEGQSFLIRNQPADPNGAYIDLRDYDPSATGFDFSHGFAVKGVHGISTIVQVLHNTSFFKINASDPAATLDSFDKYRQNWRVTKTQSVMGSGVNP